MNKERVLQVADAIEKRTILDLGFNMATYISTNIEGVKDRSGHHCGTTACIAGWAVSVQKAARNANDVKTIKIRFGPHGDLHDAAQEYLGLTNMQAERLFSDAPRLSSLFDTTPQRAVAVLRNFAETGIVDWEIEA